MAYTAEPASTAEATPSRSVPRSRHVLSATLIVLGCLLAPAAIHSVWLHDTLLNTDFDDLALAVPILTVLTFTGGIVASANRRRTIFRGAVGLAFVMLLFLVIWNRLCTPYQHVLPASVNRAAAGTVYDQLISFLLLTLRPVFALAVVIALAAWLAGPSRIATRVRTTARDLVTRTPGQGAIPSEMSRVVRRHRNLFRLAAVVVGLVILVPLNHPGPGAVAVIAIIVLVLLAVIEVLGRAAQPEVKGPRGTRAAGARARQWPVRWIAPTDESPSRISCTASAARRKPNTFSATSRRF